MAEPVSKSEKHALVAKSNFPNVKKSFQRKETENWSNKIDPVFEEIHNLLSVRLRVAVHYFDP